MTTINDLIESLNSPIYLFILGCKASWIFGNLEVYVDVFLATKLKAEGKPFTFTAKLRRTLVGTLFNLGRGQTRKCTQCPAEFIIWLRASSRIELQ